MIVRSDSEKLGHDLACRSLVIVIPDSIDAGIAGCFSKIREC